MKNVYRVDRIWGSTTRCVDGVTTYDHPATYAIWGGTVSGYIHAGFASRNREAVEALCAHLNAVHPSLVAGD